MTSGRATFWNTVREESRLKCWKIMPIERRSRRHSASLRAPTSRPNRRTRPELACSSPLTSRISVDLPAPDGPMTPVIEPGSTLRLTSCSAGTEA